MNNFTFLTKEKIYESFAKACVDAEKSVVVSYATTAILARRALEVALKWVFKYDSDLKVPHQDHLNALINHHVFKKIIDPKLLPMLTYIQKLGNKAAHTTKPITREQAVLSLRNLYEFALWIDYCYSKDVHEAAFDERILPDSENQVKSQDELKQLCEVLALKDKELEETTKENEGIRQQNTINREYKVNELLSDEIRKLYIQLELELSGWKIGTDCIQEVNISGTRVDYVLYGDKGKPLAVIETKKTSIDHEAGQKQAQSYADYVEEKIGNRPVIFYTNGFEYFLWDEETDVERSVSGIYTQEEIEWFIHKQKSKKSLNNAHMTDQISNRYYQKMALNAVCESLEQGNRKALVVMATGAGKTRIAISMMNILTNCGWAKNILYLADREELINQAKDMVAKWLPNVSLCSLLNSQDNPNSNVVFSTYPAMIKAIDMVKNDEGNQLFSNGHFDLIIIDESHRSIYKKYHAIFNYFDSLLLGLTAIPKNEIDRYTYKVFEIKHRKPTFAYELADAVEDGYLVPYHTIETRLKFLEEGIHYDELSEEDKEEFEETFEDDVFEISSDELNSFLFNADTVDTVIHDVMTKGIKVDSGKNLGKTIIFAKNKDHANYIINRFNQLYPEYKGEYARVIYAGVKGVKKTFEQFKVKDQLPQIAVSVEMLDTGVDIPELVNLVFFKKVQSKEKFWQMIGRGTRPCKDLLGPGVDKESYRIFDYCSNFEYFRENKKDQGASVKKSLSEKLFNIQVQIAQALQLNGNQQEEHFEYKETLIVELLKVIKAIDQNKFNARMQMKYIYRYRKASAFEALTDDDVRQLKEYVAPLVLMVSGDKLAKQFDYLMYTIEYGVLKQMNTENAIKKIISIAKELSVKGNIKEIKQHDLLLLAIQTSTYWENADVLDCETVRVILRDLISFIDNEDNKTYYTDFMDEVLEVKTSFEASQLKRED